MTMIREETYECARCHAPVLVCVSGKNKYCAYCAHELVEVYEAELTRLMDVVGDVDQEIIKSLIP